MDDTTQAALDILNAAWVAVPMEFRAPAQLLDPVNPLPHAVHLMAKALHPPPEQFGQDNAEQHAGDLYDPEA